MANSHVGHDCHVGNDVIFANGAVLGGHVTVADNVFIGGNTAVHQFCRVGEGAMLGGVSGITRDIIPFGFAFGPKAELVGLNVVGLKRRKFTRGDIHRIRSAYQALFFGDGTFARALRARERGTCQRPGDRQDRLVHSRRRQAPADDARGRVRGHPTRTNEQHAPRTSPHDRAARPTRRTASPRSRSFAAPEACRLRWPTPPRAAAAAWCCLRCAASPIPRASPPIRITGPGWASSNRFMRIAETEGCRDIAFIGSVTRPSLWTIRPDWRVLLLMPQIVRLYRGGDDHLQSGIGRLFEQHGFRLLGPKDIAPELTMPLGPLGSRAPAERDRADIARGLAVLRRHRARHDVGQAVVVAENQVLAVEGPEGTDRAVARVAELRTSGRIRSAAGTGVLVKAAKVGQDHRIDLPTIGPQTVEGAAAAGLAGIAVVAGSTFVAEPQAIAAAADRAKLFVVGVEAGRAAS